MHHSGGGLGGILVLLFELGIYVYFALAFQTIAKKTNTPNDWMAWVPILNMWLMIQVAGKEPWWIVVCLIPLANIVAIIMIMMPVAEKMGKPNWWGILMIVPFVNLIVPGYLAWG